MVAASSVDVTQGERTLLGRALPGPTASGAAGVCRGARRRGAGDGGRMAVGAVGNTGGRRESRIGRAVIGKADDIWSGNGESIEIVSVDVRPLVSVVHSGEAGEFAGGWLVGASILNGDLNAARVVLRLAYRMKSNDLVANQILPRGQPSWNVGSPFVAIGDQLIRGPLSIRVSTLIDLEPFTIGSGESRAISIAGSHESGYGTLVITRPVGPLESHVTSSVDDKRIVRADVASLVAGNIGIRDIQHGTIVRNLTNDSGWGGAHVRVGEWKPARLSLTVGGSSSNIAMGGHVGDSSEQCSEGSEVAHR